MLNSDILLPYKDYKSLNFSLFSYNENILITSEGIVS